jgi:hypothetical protein
MLPRSATLVFSALFAAVTLLTVACTVQTTPTTTGTPAPSATTPTDPTPATPADTPNVAAYSEAEVQDLFDSRCVKCHDARSANVDLSAPFTKNTVGVPTGGTTGKTICGRGSAIAMRIQPGDREKSLLWHKVKATQDCGSPMPYDKGNKPLDATELERLGLYIDGLGK